MKKTLFLIPALLFTVVALMGATRFFDGNADLNAVLGVLAFGGGAAVFWRWWLQGRRERQTLLRSTVRLQGEAAEAFKKGLSKKKRRKLRQEQEG